MPVRVCAILVGVTDGESCKMSISTNPVCVEAGEYGLTRGTSFFAPRLEVVAVARLLWIEWCVFGVAIVCSFTGNHFFKFV